MGRRTQNQYDANGRLVQVTQNQLASQPQNYQQQYNLVTQYGYDRLGRQVAITDTLGRVTRTGYDPAGRPALVTQNLWDGQLRQLPKPVQPGDAATATTPPGTARW